MKPVPSVHPPRLWISTYLLGCAVLLGGCNGAIGGRGEDPNGGPGGGAGNGGGGGGTGGPFVPPVPGAPLCNAAAAPPSRAPLRRLTPFEYNNTVADLLGETMQPANVFPADQIANGFGNDAEALSVSILHAEKYESVAEVVAARATQTPAALGRLAACASNVTATAEESCARTIIDSLAPRAFRRPLETGEADSLLALYRTLRMKATATFASSIAGVIEAVLQAPDFLYRVEFGVPDRDNPARRRPTAHEMASRLSYLLWGTMPDETLRAAANSGELLTAQGVMTHATRMLDDSRSRPMIRFFFDNLLPLSELGHLERDKTLYPTFSATIGSFMREETHQFLDHEIFQAGGSGTWPGVLTAPYTFVNGPLAAFYGMPAVTGDAFRKADLDITKRLGILTQGGFLAGSTHSNVTNPVLRGAFIVNKLMCYKVELPTDPAILAKVTPPAPYSGATARERFDKHRADPVCAGCHQFMDPIGLALENFDPVGLHRTTENGVPIDATGEVPGVPGKVNGPVELVQKLATSEDAQNCFSSHWVNFAYGRTLTGDEECSSRTTVATAFKDSGYNVRKMLLALTQTDAFLYLPASQ
jgi:hypothetical protein